MKELHLRMPAGLLDRLDAQRKKDGTTTDRSDFIRRVVEKEITRLENRSARDLVMKPQLLSPPPTRSDKSATEQSAASSTEQSSHSSTEAGN
jgi:Arc/MetJ-type ribon-helix-helix transcriptional regulator